MARIDPSRRQVSIGVVPEQIRCWVKRGRIQTSHGKKNIENKSRIMTIGKYYNYWM